MYPKIMGIVYMVYKLPICSEKCFTLRTLELAFSQMFFDNVFFELNSEFEVFLTFLTLILYQFLVNLIEVSTQIYFVKGRIFTAIT